MNCSIKASISGFWLTENYAQHLICWALLRMMLRLTGSLWLNPFTLMIKPCSPATSLYSSLAVSAPYAGSDRFRDRMLTKISRRTTLHEWKRKLECEST